MKYAILITSVIFAVQGEYVGSPSVLAYPGAQTGYSGHYSVTPALVNQDSNIIRSYGNLGQISTVAKKISTPFSTVQKTDVRVSNDALAYHGVHHPAAYAYASPPVHHATPVAFPAAPAPVKEVEHYPAPAVYQTTAVKPVYQAQPIYAHQKVVPYAAAPAHHGASLLGVAYSAAPVVSHMTYSNGYGVSYGY